MWKRVTLVSVRRAIRLSSLLELIYARKALGGADYNNDPKAICSVCGSAGAIHGHIDLGGVECADNYFALCLSCFWAWHREEFQQFHSADAPREFDYSTNTYGVILNAFAI